MSYLKKMEYEIVLKDSLRVIRNCHILFLLVSTPASFIWANRRQGIKIPFVKMAADGNLKDCGFDKDCDFER